MIFLLNDLNEVCVRACVSMGVHAHMDVHAHVCVCYVHVNT